MSSFRSRPQFEFEAKGSPKEVVEKIDKALHSGMTECKGVVSQDYILLKVPERVRHFWSPQLNMRIVEEEGKTMVKGKYGPAPTVWAMFLYSYIGLGMIALFLGMYGMSNIMLGKESLIIWSVPVIFGIILVLWLFAQGGQKMGAQQMFAIHHFVEEVFGGMIEVK